MPPCRSISQSGTCPIVTSRTCPWCFGVFQTWNLQTFSFGYPSYSQRSPNSIRRNPRVSPTPWNKHTMELAHSSRAKELFNQQRQQTATRFALQRGSSGNCLEIETADRPAVSDDFHMPARTVWYDYMWFFYAHRKARSLPSTPWPGSAQPIGSKISTKQIGLNPERKHGTHILLKARLDYIFI